MRLRNEFSHIKKYYDNVNACQTAKILPGEFYATSENEMITTVLGSCVSACIYDERNKCGGMNHFMLPGDQNSSDDTPARYGIYAMESLINAILKMGSRKENLKAKLFGGGQIIANMTDVGRKNIQFARSFLVSEGIPLESHDLGLAFPRKVNFYPLSGRVRVKRLQSLQNNTIETREIQYMQVLSNKDQVNGEIELF
ncbi:MAG: chemoreceptor glutamine deamidase CheD [Gammaproteobacteria bacterium]